MQETSYTFADLMAPQAAGDFLRDVHHKSFLHVPGAADKFRFAIGWDELALLLGASDIWTGATLSLFKGGRPLPAADYTRSEGGLTGRSIDAGAVNALLAEGAALVLRDVATLSPGLKRIAAALGVTPSGKVRADLGSVKQAGSALPTRFDTADLFVLQISGAATWRIYGRPLPDPLAHPRFLDLPQDYAEQNRGALQAEIALQPGGVLYLPAGTCYEVTGTGALALHAAFAVESVPVLTVLSLLYEAATGDELFRAALPDPDLRGGQALDEHLMRLAGRINTVLGDKNLQAQLAAFARGFHDPADHIDLPRDAKGR